MKNHIILLLLTLGMMTCTTKKQEVNTSEVVTNGNFENWAFETQRDEVASAHFIDSETLFQDKPTLAIAGDDKFYSIGQWVSYEDVDPGKYYQFKVYFTPQNVDEPYRCVLSKIKWLDHEGNMIGWPDYPRNVRDKTVNNWEMMTQTYRVPDNTVKATIELIFRWDADGKVNFGGMSFEEVSKPEPRKVNLATIHYRPRNGKDQIDNLNQFAPYIIEAAEKGADIVCLPEGSNSAGTGMDYVTGSEPIPGPSTEFLGKLAKEHSIYIVAGMCERDGPVVYNSAILMDRNGNLAGTYRKLSVPREEIEGGITPGDGLPVFDTDFGRIGLMICMDSSFPEQSRALAMKGADVILLPIWGGFVTLMKARALENQVYLISSSYDTKSAIFDRRGEILAEATEDNRVAVVEVDLNEQTIFPWLGEFKNRIPREIPTKKSSEWR